jgi:nucleoside-diphosphate-sugar epimerase
MKNTSINKDINRICITGSSGFIGSRLIQRLAGEVDVYSHYHRFPEQLPEGVDYFVKEVSGDTDWHNELEGIDVVIHTAARVHIMDEVTEDPLTEFRKVNTQGTLQLARQAVEMGVKRFVFISSIKVNGESSEENKPFTPGDDFIPDDPYGLSKYEAEQGLLKISKQSTMEVVIIRPPLVYGPGVKANFARMLAWAKSVFPLPFGAINDNKRSLIAVENLIDFIICCISHPRAANEIFLVSDGDDISTTALFKKVARAYGKTPMLVPIPIGIMHCLAGIVGKRAMTDRLFGSLQVDSSKARTLLDWTPIVTMDEQLKKIAELEK